MRITSNSTTAEAQLCRLNLSHNNWAVMNYAPYLLYTETFFYYQRNMRTSTATVLVPPNFLLLAVCVPHWYDNGCKLSKLVGPFRFLFTFCSTPATDYYILKYSSNRLLHFITSCSTPARYDYVLLRFGVLQHQMITFYYILQYSSKTWLCFTTFCSTPATDYYIFVNKTTKLKAPSSNCQWRGTIICINFFPSNDANKLLGMP